MGKCKHYLMNDGEMYQYFEARFSQEEGRKLPSKWKVNEETADYGLTERYTEMLLGSKKLLYGAEDAGKQVCLIENFERFLHEYVNIEGLEELFINNYGAIENHIFLEHDTLGKSKNIREHAKHQMKNAYLGSVLLLECDYLKDMAERIYQGQGAVTYFLKHEVEKILKKTSRAGKSVSVEKNKMVDKLKEITYKIFMVSSLLHDIGYPLAYYLRAAKQMTDYPPYLKILSPTVKAEFAELKAYLLDSKLFQLMDQERIYKKYREDDHGVLSALSLLMHFYHNGKIYSLTEEQRCIIEMSAIAIYRHTDRFAEGERMVYLADPISYMVRLCDDMQEWQRFKISIDEKHNYLQCGNCGRRIPEERGNYICECGQNYRKITQINNRKMNYICLCDELEIEKREDKVKIIAKFDLMKQLEILLEDYCAVRKSKEDLERIQEGLKHQALTPDMEIDFFVSNNPIRIIEKMIEESKRNEEEILNWMNSELHKAEKKKCLLEFWEGFEAKRRDNPFGDEVEKNRRKYWEKVKSYILQYYGEIYSLHEFLEGG